MKHLIILFFLANLGGISQASAICENQNNDTLISVEFTQEKEFVFLNIQAQASNPIFSCELSLKYNADVLQFIEYQIEENWLAHISTEKNELKILQSRLRYTYWITREQISLGTFKFKIRKKIPVTEFVFEKTIVIELEQFINPKIIDQPCWAEKIKLKIE